MFDFSSLSNNLEGYSLTNIIIIALVSFVMSSLIALTYQKTSREIESPKYFIQALILISIPVATVMQAIGDSLARGLGMLGALAIIRFRTTLRNPRNMVFMFTSISVGIASGVYGIAIAVIGTLSFCLIVILIHYSPLSKLDTIIGYLQFELIKQEEITPLEKEQIQNALSSYCQKFDLKRYTISKRGRKIPKEIVLYEYKIRIENREKATFLVNELSQMGLQNVKINFRDDYEKI